MKPDAEAMPIRVSRDGGESGDDAVTRDLSSSYTPKRVVEYVI